MDRTATLGSKQDDDGEQEPHKRQLTYPFEEFSFVPILAD